MPFVTSQRAELQKCIFQNILSKKRSKQKDGLRGSLTGEGHQLLLEHIGKVNLNMGPLTRGV